MSRFIQKEKLILLSTLYILTAKSCDSKGNKRHNPEPSETTTIMSSPPGSVESQPKFPSMSEPTPPSTNDIKEKEIPKNPKSTEEGANKKEEGVNVTEKNNAQDNAQQPTKNKNETPKKKLFGLLK